MPYDSPLAISIAAKSSQVNGYKKLRMATEIFKSCEIQDKNNKTDIFGFGNYVYKNDPQRWKEIKDIWDDEIFPSLEIEIEVNLKLQAKGSINDTVEVRE